MYNIANKRWLRNHHRRYYRHQFSTYRPTTSKLNTDTNSITINTKDQICELSASSIRYGLNSTSEVGIDLKNEFKASSVVIFTDKNIASRTPVLNIVLQSLHDNGIQDVDIYDSVRVEPNDDSFKDAIHFMNQRKTRRKSHFDGIKYDAIIAVGGGSVIDTAKCANLYSCHPPPNNDFYHYVNPILGKGMPVPGPLLPLIAIPTTAGTGSETTGVAIFDDSPTKSKTGIAHRRLRPTLGIIDPMNTATLPSEVAKYSGLDVLCHAIESYTALPYTERPAPASPLLRPAYQGSNPISDVWSLHALRLTSKYIQRAVEDVSDLEARSNMLLASSAAGIGFGNAGVHLCHGMSYPTASNVKSFQPKEGYFNLDHSLIPHGLSVIANAPSVFRFTGVSCPERHLECADILAKARNRSVNMNHKDSAGEILANEILELMNSLNVPIGLQSLGYTKSDIPELVKGTLPQHRVTKLSPRQPVGEEELTTLFMDALLS